MATEVPATRTPVTKEEAARYIVNGLRAKLGRDPTEPEAVYSHALAWVETANGNALIQHNAGNVSCWDDERYSGLFWRPPWYPENHDPKYDALHAAMLEGKAPRAFRAYPDAQTGWNDYLREVVRRRSLLAAMNLDDPAAVVRELAATNYSKDYQAKHVATFRSLAAQIRRWHLYDSLPKATAASAPDGTTPSIQIRVQNPQGERIGVTSVSELDAPGLTVLSGIYGAPVCIAYPNGWRMLKFSPEVTIPARSNLPYTPVEQTEPLTFGTVGGLAIGVLGIVVTLMAASAQRRTAHA